MIKTHCDRCDRTWPAVNARPAHTINVAAEFMHEKGRCSNGDGDDVDLGAPLRVQVSATYLDADGGQTKADLCDDCMADLVADASVALTSATVCARD